MKGLLCFIFHDHLGNSSNGGISSRCKEVVLLDAADVFDATAERPAVRLVRRGNYTIAVPVMEPHGKLIGPMFGGCFIHTCDSRFRKFVGHDYPVPLHDRWESPELNRMLSI